MRHLDLLPLTFTTADAGVHTFTVTLFLPHQGFNRKVGAFAGHHVTPTGDNRRDWEASDTKTDGSYEWTFDRSGTFDYVCTIHPTMDATVTVTD